MWCCGLQQLQRLLNSRLFLSLVITACLSGQPHQLTHHIIPPVAAGDQQQQQVGCHNQICGGIRIPYPFKLADATCPTFSPYFILECDHKTDQLFFNHTNTTFEPNSTISKLKVLNLTHDSIALDVTNATVTMTLCNRTECYLSSSATIPLASFPSPYVFSDDNKLGIFGCASGTVLLAPEGPDNDGWIANNTTGGSCDTLCRWGGSNPLCGNQHCCVSSWPQAYFLRWAQYGVLPSLTYDGTNNASASATLLHYNYSHFENKTYGIRLKWALPVSNDTSTEAIKKRTDYACSSNAKPIKVPEVPGYLCSCFSGYRGDGYGDGYIQGSNCTGSTSFLADRRVSRRVFCYAYADFR